MSGESVTVSVPVAAVLSPRDRKVLRYALGATLCMGVALGFGYPLSFLTPVLALGFLAAPAPLGWRAGLTLLATIGVACLIGLALIRFLLPYPLVYVPFMGLLLFRIYHAKAEGASPLLILWLLIALLALPLVAMQSAGIARLVAAGILFGATMTVILVQLIWFLIPDAPVTPVAATKAATPAPPVPSAAEKFRNAALSTAVVFPLMVVFMLLEQTGSVLILIFVAILSLQPGFAGSFRMGVALILGNALGGVVSIMFYELLVMVPVFPFMLLLTLLCGLVLGAQLFSGKKTGALFGMGFSTVLLIIGSTTGASGDAEAKVITRVLQIMLAVIYVVIAGGLLERLTRRKGN